MIGQFLATFMFLLSLFKSNFSIVIIVCNIYFDFDKWINYKYV